MSFLVKLPAERYSSTAFDGFVGSSDLELGDAKAMAWMCQFAYETDEPGKIKDILDAWGLSLVEDGIVVEEVDTALPKSSTCGFVASGRGATVVAFAGTDPVVLANWITNFDIHFQSTGAARGYATAAAAVWPALRALLGTQAAGSKIIVTGHSLGGALAVLTAHQIGTETGRSVHAVYTFGTPRPGDATFAGTYNQRIGQRTYRLVHGEDLVPTVGPSFLKFRHVGRFLNCPRGGTFNTRDLTADTGSDEPEFVRGISNELIGLLRGPLSQFLSPIDRLKLAASLTIGAKPAGMRTDPAGILIELLSPRLRDHMPDRYIGACG
jgi:pimeloyl-ACP methyl ester carboxylesterase